MRRLLGLIAVMLLAFGVVYGVMRSDNWGVGAPAVAAHSLVVIIGILGAGLSAVVLLAGVRNAEVQVWMTRCASRQESPWEYWFWIAFHALCGTAFAGLVVRSMAKLAS